MRAFTLIFISLLVLPESQSKPLSIRPSLALQGSIGGTPVASVTNSDDSTDKLTAGEGIALLAGLRTKPFIHWRGFSISGVGQLGYKVGWVQGESQGLITLNRWPVEFLLSIKYSFVPISLDVGAGFSLFTTISSSFTKDIPSFRASPSLGLPIYLNYSINKWLLAGFKIEWAPFTNPADGRTRDGSNYGVNFRVLF